LLTCATAGQRAALQCFLSSRWCRAGGRAPRVDVSGERRGVTATLDGRIGSGSPDCCQSAARGGWSGAGRGQTWPL